MKRREMGEFLYRFYRKRVASFMANIYKASITGDSRDIHRARLAFKKTVALYDLFEIVKPGAIRHQSFDKLFRDLFRHSGKIREIQVNYILLSRPDFTAAELQPFLDYLHNEELLATRKFLKAIRRFKEAGLKTTGKVIRKICRDNPVANLHGKTSQFIREQAEEIRRLQSGKISDRKIHKIRQHLKSMSTIAMLVSMIRKSKKLELITSLLNRTEIMIGDWHDRIVLKDTIDHFLAVTGSPEDEIPAIRKLQKVLVEENHSLLISLMPEVKMIVTEILASAGRLK